jgi:HPt (histidine-containing phosphotransfer) domain-containing protein
LTEPVDHRALAALSQATGDDPAFLAELIDTFLRDAPALLETLRGALDEADAQQVRRAAHTLKSNGRVFGATTLAELCQQLEAIARKDTLAGAAELLGRIEGEYASVERALQEIP